MGSAECLLTRLGMLKPIIQAPMAGVSTPEMAAAVSNAGGLGSLGIGASTIVQARQMIEATRQLTDKPFNVNVFCHAAPQAEPEKEAAWLRYLAPLFEEFGGEPPAGLNEIYRSFNDDPEMLTLLLELRPAVVSFHFGLPSPHWLTSLRDAGIVLLATATSPDEARQIEEAGLDGIVVQGIEAGGHRGVFSTSARDERFTTLVLLRLLSMQCSLPLIAAGGIMDGQGIASALAAGAVAAQMGTAFILCPESAANASYRENLLSTRAGETRLTSVFSGRPARGMVNRLVRYGEAEGSPVPADYPLAYDAAKQLNALAATSGCHEFAAQWAGQGAALSRALPAADLVDVLMTELNHVQG